MYTSVVLSFLLGLTAPVSVPIALIFARDGQLPWWASWYVTPDTPLPGDLSEPTVAACYSRFGWFVCSWYWLGIRNRGNGLAFKWARLKPNGKPWPVEPGYYEDGDMWWERRPILGGRWQLKRGWRTFYVGKMWWGVPCWTVTVP